MQYVIFGNTVLRECRPGIWKEDSFNVNNLPDHEIARLMQEERVGFERCGCRCRAVSSPKAGRTTTLSLRICLIPLCMTHFMWRTGDVRASLQNPLLIVNEEINCKLNLWLALLTPMKMNKMWTHIISYKTSMMISNDADIIFWGSSWVQNKTVIKKCNDLLLYVESPQQICWLLWCKCIKTVLYCYYYLHHNYLYDILKKNWQLHG